MSKILNTFFLVIVIALFACEEKNPLQFIEPEVFVSSAYLIANSTTIEVNCETINPSSINKEEFGICWAEKPTPVITDNYQYSGNNSKEEGAFVVQILNVKPNTSYYIRGYMRVNGRDVYSKEFIYAPVLAKGWNRLQDIPRIKNIINLPTAFLQNNTIPTFKRKLIGFEESFDFVFNDAARFWSGKVNDSKLMVYDQFTADIEYASGKFDFISGGGYQIENTINGKKKFLKNAATITYPLIEITPGADVPAAGFGAGNKAFVIEVKPYPNMYAFNEDNFLWEKMHSPPFTNFTNIKATRANGNGLVVLENALLADSKMKVYFYEFKIDNWQQLSDFPGPDRTGGVLFSIKNKVYFGLGEQKITENGLKDMWEFDLTSKTWTQIANYPGSGSTNIAFVRKNNSVFIGMGYSSILTNIGTSRKFMAYDFWEFRP